MDIVEPIFCNPEGVTLKTQDLYLACRENSCTLLVDKNDCAKFFVSKTPANDIITFKSFYTNKYLGLFLYKGHYQLEATRNEVDDACKFTVIVLDGGQIALKGHNQRFLTPIGSNDKWTIEAVSDQITNDCKFYIAYGDSVEPVFQISNIHWKNIPDKFRYSDMVLDTLSYANGNCTTVSNTFTFPCHKEIEQKTMWKQLWGYGAMYEYETKFPGTDCTIKVKFESMSDTATATVLMPINIKPVNVIISPKKTIIVRLVLKRSEAVTLPFIATVKRFNKDGSAYELNIEGFWIGYLYQKNSEKIQVCETELGIQ